jgi:hypothetical protein
MKLEDVLEVLPMLMLENLLDQFVFIWGCEQCSKRSSEISPQVSLLFKGFETSVLYLPWTTLWEGGSNILIDDEPNKVLWNPK